MIYVTATKLSRSFLRRSFNVLKVYHGYRRDQLAHARLMRMSNRNLADLGITRDDVRRASVRPINWHGA